MLSAIRDFFDRRIAEQAGEPPERAEERARLAAAALLVEVVRSDDCFGSAEREAVLESVRRNFGLNERAAHELLSLAEAEARDAHDDYQFTSKINAAFPPERKERLIEELWRVAYADRALHRYEEHLIRRVARLLHVSDKAFIRAKLRQQIPR